MAGNTERDKITGRETTGHEWDGLKELNTPLPSWWLYVFYATIVWSIGYYIAYPAIPTFVSYTKGLLGYNTRAEFQREMDKAAEGRKAFLDAVHMQPVERVAADAALKTFAVAGGRAAFADNCAPCHGAGGQGAKGYPVLADDEWLWGGGLADIERTIRFGVRSDHADARLSEMPRFGADGMLKPAEIADVTEYVLSLSGGRHDAVAAGRGKDIFGEQCAACHGPGGEGLAEFGAPRLSGAIWLHGGTREAIRAQIYAPKMGVMPGWRGRLDDVTIRMLAIYVHSLGGGK